MDEKAVCIIYTPAIIHEEHFMETHNGIIIISVSLYIYIFIYIFVLSMSFAYTIYRVKASAQVKFRCYLFNLKGFLLFINDVEQEQRK
jgi:hypothetical protein